MEKIVGLDVGTTSVRCVIAEIIKEDQVNILGFGECSNIEGIKQGAIIDINKTTEGLLKAIGDAEQMAGSGYVQRVTMSISGENICSFNGHGKIAIRNERGEISRQDVDLVVSAARDNLDMNPTLLLLHNVPQEFEVDNQKNIENPIGMVGQKLDVHLHTIAAPITSIKNLEKCCDIARLELEEIVFKGLASAEVILDVDQKRLGAVLLEMGGGTTDMVVFIDGKLVHSCVIPIGGEFITKDIAMGLKVTTLTAEKLKIEHGFVGSSPNQSKEIQITEPLDNSGKTLKFESAFLKTIIEARLEEILSLVKEELDSLKLKEFIASGIILSGGGARLKGLENFIEDKVGLKCRLGTIKPFGNNFNKVNQLKFATALGLIKYSLGIHDQFDFQPRRAGMAEKFLGFFKKMADKILGEP